MMRKRQLFVACFVFTLLYVFILNVTNYQEGEIKPRNKIVEIEGWTVNTTRNVSEFIFINKSALILPNKLCETEDFLTVVVLSAPHHFQERNTIRSTWGSEKFVLNKTISYYFLLGETLNDNLQKEILFEAENFNDILQERFLDSYNNLTLKSINMMKLISNHCFSNTKFVMKVDDDIFVNVENLVQMLASKGDASNIIYGKKICRAFVIRDSTNKWYVPNYLYNKGMYPDYVSGTAYVFSVDVAEKLLNASFSIPIVHLEDIYLTGICAKKANVKLEGNYMFVYRQPKLDFCLMRMGISFHEFNYSTIHYIYEELKDPNLPEKCAKYKENVYKGDCKKPKKRRTLSS
ncbi:unnamed protein product [Brassicogethes aeneus]|uniref:Hexosyltransferase n=1 Tax=Brassicogethes aeneus TaxID=1431903 RepID=A0A9P0AZL3_BRAAE|nr:unnamed protein product [Brassicogethes aeneus]